MIITHCYYEVVVVVIPITWARSSRSSRNRLFGKCIDPSLLCFEHTESSIVQPLSSWGSVPWGFPGCTPTQTACHKGSKLVQAPQDPIPLPSPVVLPCPRRSCLPQQQEQCWEMVAEREPTSRMLTSCGLPVRQYWYGRNQCWVSSWN